MNYQYSEEGSNKFDDIWTMDCFPLIYSSKLSIFLIVTSLFSSKPERSKGSSSFRKNNRFGAFPAAYIKDIS